MIKVEVLIGTRDAVRRYAMRAIHQPLDLSFI